MWFDQFFSVATNDSLAGTGLGSHKNWLHGLDSPLIQQNDEESGQKELKLRFDVSQYSPDEIVVKTVDNKLLVSKICLVKKLLNFHTVLNCYFRYMQNMKNKQLEKQFFENITENFSFHPELTRNKFDLPFLKMAF